MMRDKQLKPSPIRKIKQGLSSPLLFFEERGRTASQRGRERYEVFCARLVYILLPLLVLLYGPERDAAGFSQL